MTISPTPLPALGVRCWRDVISPEIGATVLNLAAETPEDDPMLELAYDEGGGCGRPRRDWHSSQASRDWWSL